ncbi:dynein regulatory complex protein 10 [Osmerus mordax]|uniref:dynein regulatory complex protein 10 n=1 Tax=Osmerus mordax TaxID=8014 RepID=UPI00350ED95B
MSAEAALPTEDVTPQTLLHCPQPKVKAREDSLKILDPSKTKLSSLETKRIAGVLDECISRVEQVALLPAVLAHLEDLSVGLGEEVTGALREHRLLEERLASLERTPGGEAVGGKRVQAEKDIQSSLKNVLRLLRDQPAARRVLRGAAVRGEGVLKGSPGVSGGMQGVLGGLMELKGVLLEKLLTSPTEERERRCYMQEVSLRHKNNMELVALLETAVEASIKDSDTEIGKKNEVIKKLKSSLHQMEKISEDFVLRMQQDAEKQSQSDAKTSEGKQSRMQQEANQLRVQLNNLIAENREVETTLRKKKYKVETEIENWIQKYDADMGEKQLELEDMMGVFEEEKEELRQLEEAYAVLEVEFSQIQEERRLAEERREEDRRLLELKSQAATLIQAMWRGHRVRKAMKGKGKAKKGKKGKGKKGK